MTGPDVKSQIGAAKKKRVLMGLLVLNIAD